MSKEITQEQIRTWQETFDATPANHLAQLAVKNNGIYKVAEDQAKIAANPAVFSIDVSTGPVANQKQSGRCWMFAALNTFRHQLLHQFKLKDFELSQNYTFFWDKFEKANYFYENILNTANLPIGDRKVAFLLETPQQDGGQWDMLVALIQKYGIVPKSAMPEVVNSSASAQLNKVLNLKLRKDALDLRTLIEKGASDREVAAAKESMLANIYHILVTTLGTPPTTFDFEYRDEEQVYHLEQGLTPQTFYEKYVNTDLEQYVSIINAPTADKPYNKTYTVEMLGNVVGGKEVCHLNVDMETFKSLAIAQLKEDETVWFGCDVGQFSNRDSGHMLKDLYDLKAVYGIDFGISKAERLDAAESLMTHAMVLTGVDLIDDKPVRWKVENSWGDKVGEKGFFTADDAWMDEYTYQIVVRKDLLSPELQAALKEAPTVLLPWDPMGALA